jgi:transposase, IS5 family
VRYGFGAKVSIVATLKEGLVVGTRSMPGNPYDGQTLHEALRRKGSALTIRCRPSPTATRIEFAAAI